MTSGGTAFVRAANMRRRSVGSGQPPLAAIIAPRALLAFWPLLAALPALVLQQGSLLPLLAILLPCVGFMLVGRLSSGGLVASWATTASWLFGLCVSIAILRAPAEVYPFNAKLAQVATIGGLFALALLAFSQPNARAERFRALLWSLPLYIAVNGALYIAEPGQQSELSITQQNANVTLAAFGLVQPRLQYLPTISGSAVIGTLCALALLSLVHLARTSRRGRSLAFALMIPSAAGLLMADTRSLIWVTSAVVAIYMTLRTRAICSVVRLSIVFAAFSAPLLLSAFGAAEAIGLGQALGRSADLGSRLGAGTGRTLIWSGVFHELGHFRLEHLTGYGQYGDLKSGVSSFYAWIFYGREGRPSYHNTALQYVLESGYFVAALYFVVIWLAVRRMAASGEQDAKAALGLLLIVLSAGCSEVAGTPLHFEAFLFLLGILAFCLTAPVAVRRTAQNPPAPAAVNAG